MIENPYLSTNASCDVTPVRKTLFRDVIHSVVSGLAVAFILYGLELLAKIELPLVYSFPSFYPLRGVVYFDPLLGFCLQFMFYGIAIGFAKHFGRLKCGLSVIAIFHVASVVLCPYLA